MTKAPILVIGAHRSGTSAVARVLDDLGVFQGARLDDNHESLFFQRLNEWLLAQCGARWDNPTAVDRLILDSRQSALAVEHLRRSVGSPRSMAYLGRMAWMRGRRIGDGACRFGFKDPRSTFTLPFWLRVFPEARIIHVHRHGVAVAQSLCVRHRRHLELSEQRFERNRPLLNWLPKRAGFGDSPRLSSLAGAFDLWEEYFVRARREVAARPTISMEFAYEDLVRDPAAHVSQLAEFCGLSVSSEAVAAAAGRITASRADAWRGDSELAEFARIVEPRVRALREGIAAEPGIGAVRAKSSPQR
ncbi:MAG: sulfotransferase [Planctomycetota bacterium]